VGGDRAAVDCVGVARQHASFCAVGDMPQPYRSVEAPVASRVPSGENAQLRPVMISQRPAEAHDRAILDVGKGT
jgi:hypothetical protein